MGGMQHVHKHRKLWAMTQQLEKLYALEKRFGKAMILLRMRGEDRKIITASLAWHFHPKRLELASWLAIRP